MWKYIEFTFMSIRDLSGAAAAGRDYDAPVCEVFCMAPRRVVCDSEVPTEATELVEEEGGNW